MGKIKDRKRREKTQEQVLDRLKDKKKRNVAKTFDDEMDRFVVLEMLPLLEGAFGAVRKQIADRAEGGLVHVENLPSSISIAYGVMGVLEEYLEKHSRKIKKY